jgi:hypothetical protein
VTGDWRRQHSEELHGLYWVTRWAGMCFLGKPEGKGNLEDLAVDGSVIILLYNDALSGLLLQ